MHLAEFLQRCKTKTTKEIFHWTIRHEKEKKKLKLNSSLTKR
jgi:hypothetical protein